MRTLIKNGTVVTACDTFAADVWIDQGTIVAIAHGSQRNLFPADREIDATGSYVMPGGIDAHTHLDMPFMGTVSRDDFTTGSIAAAHGGTTMLIDFAIQPRGAALRAGLDLWQAKAEGKAAIDYSFHMIMSDVNASTLEEMGSLSREGITSYKLFTAYPNALFSDDGQILRAMQRAGELGALISMHAENGIAINVLIEQAVARGESAPRFHALTRPEISEAEATHRALCLAEMAGAPVYIVHMTSSRALQELIRFRDRGLPAYGETCPQYLQCSLDDISRPGFEGAKFVCSPPMRPKQMQEDLWRGLQTGHLQVVATDHCPFDFQGQKDMGRELFTKIPNGMPAIETRLHLLWEGGVVAKRFGPSRFVEMVSTAPAKLFGLYPRKGALAAGSDADIVVWDPNREQSLDCSALHMRVDYSPYEGKVVHGSPSHVLSNGKVIIEDGKYLGHPGEGRFVRRSTLSPL
jgi:dihydropyrimidinase